MNEIQPDELKLAPGQDFVSLGTILDVTVQSNFNLFPSLHLA